MVGRLDVVGMPGKVGRSMLEAEDCSSHIALSFDGGAIGGVHVEASDFSLCSWLTRGMLVETGNAPVVRCTVVEAVGLDST